KGTGDRAHPVTSEAVWTAPVMPANSASGISVGISDEGFWISSTGEKRVEFRDLDGDGLAEAIMFHWAVNAPIADQDKSGKKGPGRVPGSVYPGVAIAHLKKVATK